MARAASRTPQIGRSTPLRATPRDVSTPVARRVSNRQTLQREADGAQALPHQRSSLHVTLRVPSAALRRLNIYGTIFGRNQSTSTPRPHRKLEDIDSPIPSSVQSTAIETPSKLGQKLGATPKSTARFAQSLLPPDSDSSLQSSPEKRKRRKFKHSTFTTQ